nr:MAG TPA: hypothetical protein [Caudoviricetes sp.]
MRVHRVMHWRRGRSRAAAAAALRGGRGQAAPDRHRLSSHLV